MNQRRKFQKFRPAVNGLEQRLVLNGSVVHAAEAGNLSNAAAPEVRHAGGHHTSSHHTSGHSGSSHSHHKDDRQMIVVADAKHTTHKHTTHKHTTHKHTTHK
jgi:hypothetical protein